ncbi:MAG: DegV family EDD domain-containing protein, partial [Vallitaleaceae bacterium]|nr:DegV family EDD domain-containing protein [Vallitaleaceae bacterium]
MKKIKLITDSTCDLSQVLIDQMAVEIVPLYVNIGERDYKDGLELMERDLYNLVEIHGELPSTAAPSPDDYFVAYKKFIEQGYDILVICVSSKMSASYQNACIARELLMFGNIEIIDSLNLSTGIGLIVCEAFDATKKDMSLFEITEYLGKLI